MVVRETDTERRNGEGPALQATMQKRFGKSSGRRVKPAFLKGEIDTRRGGCTINTIIRENLFFRREAIGRDVQSEDSIPKKRRSGMSFLEIKTSWLLGGGVMT